MAVPTATIAQIWDIISDQEFRRFEVVCWQTSGPVQKTAPEIVEARAKLLDVGFRKIALAVENFGNGALCTEYIDSIRWRTTSRGVAGGR